MGLRPIRGDGYVDLVTWQPHLCRVFVLIGERDRRAELEERTRYEAGEVEGRIAATPAGRGGFGSDPVFVPHEGDGRTFAEMSADEKHAISFPKTWDNIQPYWLGKAGCDLTQKDPMAQYTPSNPPKP